MNISPFSFVFLAFIFTIVNRLYTKKILFKLDSFSTALLTNFVGGIIVLIFFHKDLPKILELSQTQAWLILLAGILWTYIAWIGNLSIAQNNFSFKEIIRQTRIIWVVLAGIFLLGETLAWKDLLGIFMIISSVYIISFKEISFRQHVSSGPILLAWSVAFVAALIAVLEKIILTNYNTNVNIYSFLMYLFPTVFLVFFLNKRRINLTIEIIKNDYGKIFFTSCFMAVSYYTALMSYKLLPISLAYPLIQTSTVIGVLVGTFLFEDGKDWPKKSFASIVAICGVLIIKFL